MKIFVSVGTHPRQFDRLLKEIDSLLAEKKLNAVVFAQSGNSGFVPRNFSCKKFLPPAKMRSRIAEADLIVSHGGAGSIIGALEQQKPLVIVPRLQRFGEHTNDHQCDLAAAMEKTGKAVAVLEIKELGNAFSKAIGLRGEKSAGAKGIMRELERFFGESVFSDG